MPSTLKTKIEFDIIIVGAGPAGCTTAYQLSGKGLKIALIDKDVFPRDKICGDGLSPDVINQLNRINPALAENFQKLPQKKGWSGVRFFAPNYKHIDISFKKKTQSASPAFVSKRMDFDYFFFKQVQDAPDIHLFQGHKITAIERLENEIIVTSDQQIFSGKVILGADGANSIVNRKLTDTKLEKHHHCAGVRQYYSGVEEFPHDGIELHYYTDILPGYFWIFALPNGQANVGLGMLSSEISKRRVNLKEKLKDIIENHPNIKDRFANAKPMEKIQGFGLPVGSRKVACSGDRFLLLGDAASLIDPLTGEGIGNAIRSGRIAADHLLKAFAKNRFDAAFNKQYDKEIYRKMWTELRISTYIQRMLRYPKTLSFLINKAADNRSMQVLLTSMLNDIDLKKELRKPSFYSSLFFNQSKKQKDSISQ